MKHSYCRLVLLTKSNSGLTKSKSQLLVKTLQLSQIVKLVEGGRAKIYETKGEVMIHAILLTPRSYSKYRYAYKTKNTTRSNVIQKLEILLTMLIRRSQV